MIDKKLKRITFTGIDQYTDPDELELLCLEYPFIEFAFLISEARTGKKDIAYPSLYVLDSFMHRDIPLALHVCGKMALTVASKGKFTKVEEFMGRYYDMFGRMQLNIGRGNEFRAFDNIPEGKK